MQHHSFFTLTLFLTALSFAQDQKERNLCDYEMGDSIVTFTVENPESKNPIVFINVHENEATSIEALHQFDSAHAYKFIWLNHQGTRRIFFNHKAEVFSVDPNRIFSHDGIVATLAYDTIVSRKAEKMAKALAHEILNYIHGNGWIISLHNNTPDNYSILSYLPGGSEAPNSAAVFVSDTMDPDDFIYTTDIHLFNALKLEKVNVILQDNINCVNDGSLSVYCGIKGIPYANVEAEDGHLLQQIELIRRVVSAIEGT